MATAMPPMTPPMIAPVLVWFEVGALGWLEDVLRRVDFGSVLGAVDLGSVLESVDPGGATESGPMLARASVILNVLPACEKFHELECALHQGRWSCRRLTTHNDIEVSPGRYCHAWWNVHG
jgi:hypothetical protein